MIWSRSCVEFFISAESKYAADIERAAKLIYCAAVMYGISDPKQLKSVVDIATSGIPLYSAFSTPNSEKSVHFEKTCICRAVDSNFPFGNKNIAWVACSFGFYEDPSKMMFCNFKPTNVRITQSDWELFVSLLNVNVSAYLSEEATHHISYREEDLPLEIVHYLDRMNELNFTSKKCLWTPYEPPLNEDSFYAEAEITSVPKDEIENLVAAHVAKTKERIEALKRK